MRAGFVDVHSHLVPGVDDGARTLEESIAALERLAGAGARAVLTTPHIDASLIPREDAFRRDVERIEKAWRQVEETWREHHPAVALHLGREVMLDTADPRFEDPRVRLAGSRYVLVEYPRLNIPAGSEDVLYRIASQGVVPVVAHVERYAYHGAEERVLDEWRHTGAVFQVNAPSLVGMYGTRAQRLAWELLESGWVDLVASDFHARGRTSIQEVRAIFAEHEGEEQERLLWSVNPEHILRDEPLESVPPLVLRRTQGRWARILGALRREA